MKINAVFMTTLVYKCMVNYGASGEVSDFWSLEKLDPAERREWCEEF